MLVKFGQKQFSLSWKYLILLGVNCADTFKSLPLNLSRPLLLLVFALCFAQGLLAQVTGGKNIYDFVDLPASSREAGAGGNLIATMDNDISLGYHNPSLLNPTMHNRVFFSDALYMGGINHGYVGYARDYDKIGTFLASAQFVSYGQFQQTDETGAEIGKFGAGDVALNLGGSHQIDRYSFGANVRLVYSQIAGYNSFGGGIDMAAAYNDTAKKLTATLVIKNIGGTFKPYYKGGPAEGMPFDIQFGFSKRFKHLPFRLGIVLHHLYTFDIRYDDPDAVTQESSILINDSSSSGGSKAGQIVDNIARHFIINGEVYITKYVWVNFGYNHLRRAELAPTAKKGLAGFSFGFGVNVKQFQVSFARARYSGTKATTQISMGVNINELVKRKKVTDAS